VQANEYKTNFTYPLLQAILDETVVDCLRKVRAGAKSYEVQSKVFVLPIINDV
jgi:hypothetical protein